MIFYLSSLLLPLLGPVPIPVHHQELSRLCVWKKNKPSKPSREREKKENLGLVHWPLFTEIRVFFRAAFSLLFASLAFCCSMLLFHPIPMLDRAPAEHERSPRECVQAADKQRWLELAEACVWAFAAYFFVVFFFSIAQCGEKLE